LSTSTEPSPPRAWRNWLGNDEFEARIAIPRDEDEVAELVRGARDRCEPVRVAGAGHSNTPLFESGGILLSTEAMSGVIRCEPERRRVSVLPGTRISALGDPLWSEGLALTNQGDIDTQAVAGAIATGTHGSGLSLQSMSATLRRARVVTGAGGMLEIDECEPDLLHAAQVSLGMLGVMTEVELAVSDAYELTEWIGHLPWEKLEPHWEQLARSHRHFSFLWFASHQTAARWDLAPPDGSSAANGCFVKVYDVGEVDAGPIAEHGGVRRVDRSYRIYPESWPPEMHEMEYMMSFERGLEAFDEVRRMVIADFPDNGIPVEVRFVAADEGLLSQNYGRPSTVVSVSGEIGKPYQPFLDRCDEIFMRYEGRPHWGKFHRPSPERLAEVFPAYEQFCQIRRELDPRGIFLNRYLASLFG
jgi:FAD/FMN-containing dehydrogenase